ncbi:MAG: SusC/RagA family TonB-linked outer membrane protein [Candidatus Saccharimonadaceae bacterium]
MKKTLYLFCILLLLPVLMIAQQQIQVSGKVVDIEDGSPLPGVTILIQKSIRGVTTDIDGTFEIYILPTDKLVFSFIGMETQTIEVMGKSFIEVEMAPMASTLDELTVVAFGKQKKESVVGSISTIKPSELKIPSSNLTTSLAGRVSGMISYQRSGEPGMDNAQFFIRGVTTFGYKKDPLILIDNSEVSTQDLARMQPDDIESFSIMKDATATSLYGSRGANGVILITTKQGKEGKAKLSIRFEESISRPTQMIKLADPITYMSLHNEAVRTRDPLQPTPYTQNKIDNTLKGSNPYVYPANNWYDILFKDQTINQRLNFNISGGGKVARYYLAGNIINDNGNLKIDRLNNFNNNISLKRYSLRSNVNINITPTTEAIVRFNGSFDDYSGPIDGGTDLYKKVMRTNPVLFPPFFKPDKANELTQHVLFGNYGEGTYLNPYADMVKGYKEYSTSQMSVQFELNQKLDFITKGLTLRGMFNTDRYSYFDVIRYYNPFYYKVGRYDNKKDIYTLDGLNEKSGTDYLGYNEGPKNITSSIYFESALNWSKIFKDKHNIGGLLVYTMRQQMYSNAGDLQRSLPYRNVGLAGRGTYEYDNRYFLELNFGYNGSERFSASERFGFFPSVGTGWIISNEDFWNDNLKKSVNKFKLKGTYGLVGNDAIGDANDRFFYLSNVNMNNGDRASSFGTYGNMGGYHLNGISISRYANEDITWETARKLNLGVEVGLWNKLDIDFEVFHEYRTNILMTRSSIPNTMGLQSAIRANVGEASARGMDISLNYNHSFNKDSWISGLGNFTYATSRFEVYEEPQYKDAPWKSRVGHSLNQMYGYVAERLFVDEEEVRNSPVQFGDYMAGDIKYKDINGDGKITEMDIVPMGYPSSPEIVYGFGLSGGWKQLDLSFFFQGLARESFMINATETSPFINGQNALLKAYAEDHWSETNRNVYALWPRLSPTHIQNNLKGSNWVLRDGSFLRLKSLELGYTVPKAIASKVKISNLRIYLSGTNLLTFSKFKLWDPEMGGNGLGYPVQKVYNLGIQLSF